tara:strand:- start:1792 stop:1995 length:204 start_codon:yes stop_codon:yes gene_type:complete
MPLLMASAAIFSAVCLVLLFDGWEDEGFELLDCGFFRQFHYLLPLSFLLYLYNKNRFKLFKGKSDFF